MTGRRTASNDCPASRRWASGNLCRFTRRSSADVAPKRHTAPRARLQAFSVISSEWRKPLAGQVRERWQDLWSFFASSLHQAGAANRYSPAVKSFPTTAAEVSCKRTNCPPGSRWRVQALFIGLREPHRCEGQSLCALVVKFHAPSRKEQRLPIVVSPNQEM